MASTDASTSDVADSATNSRMDFSCRDRMSSTRNPRPRQPPSATELSSSVQVLMSDDAALRLRMGGEENDPDSDPETDLDSAGRRTRTPLSRKRSLPCSWRCRMASRLFLLFATLLLSPLSASLECFCTEDHCDPFGACEGTVCMIGILREGNQVIRTCGNHELGCYRYRKRLRKDDVPAWSDEDDGQRWSDLCVCDAAFCNTFAYLRANTRREPVLDGALGEPPGGYGQYEGGGGGGGGGGSHAAGWSSAQAEREAYKAFEQDHLVFHRVDRPDDGYMPNPDAPTTGAPFLVILLVVVPLAVGAGTVLVVAFNYYCHLC